MSRRHGLAIGLALAYSLALLGDQLYVLILKLNHWFNRARARLGLGYWSLSQYLKHKAKNAVNFANPNRAAEPYMDKAILDNPLIYPPADVLSTLLFQKDIGEDEQKYQTRWTAIKSA